MKTTQKERDRWRREYTYPGADTGFIALLDDADELARLRERLESLPRSNALSFASRLASADVVAWSDVVALLDGEG